VRRYQQLLCQHADRWRLWPHVARKREQGLVLLWRHTSRVGCGLAEGEKAAELEAEGGDGSVLLA
jgi:hypothetical protein